MNDKPRWDERLAPCIHEAGHAVIAHTLGVQVIDLHVNFGPGDGVCNIALTDLRTSIHICLSGPSAEMHYFEGADGCPAERHPLHSATTDRKQAWERAQLVYPGNLGAAQRLRNEARDVVAVMVEDHWERIERIGLAASQTPDGVLRHGTLRRLLDEG